MSSKLIKFYTYTDQFYSSDIRSNFNEITNSIIKNNLKEKLKYHNFNIYTRHNQVTIDDIFIKKFLTHLHCLHIDTGSGFNSNDKKNIIVIILFLNNKVCFVVYP